MSKLINVLVGLVFVLAVVFALGMFLQFLASTTAPSEALAVAAEATTARQGAETEANQAEDLLDAAKAAGDGEAVVDALAAAWDARTRATEARIEEARAWAAKDAVANMSFESTKDGAIKIAMDEVKRTLDAAAAPAAKAADAKAHACASAHRALLDAENGWAAVRAAEEAFNVNTQPFSAEEARLLRLIGEELDCIEQVSRARAAEREAC